MSARLLSFARAAALLGASAFLWGCQDVVSPATVLAEGHYGITGIAVDDAGVYFIKKDGTLNRVSKDGGSVKELASGLTDPQEVLVDDTDVYCTTSVGTIERVPKGGGSFVTLIEGEPDLREIALDKDRVYFSTGTAGALRAILKDGADEGPETLREGEPGIGPLVYFDSFLFWGIGDEESAVRRMDVAATSVAEIASAQASTVDVFADASFVYWANSGTGEGTGTVTRALTDGNDVRVIAADQHLLYKVIGDEKDVFWSSLDGSISTAPADASAEPFVMSDGPDSPTFLAQDEQYLYSARFETGTILMRPKPQAAAGE